jgi:hypothetical protein
VIWNFSPDAQDKRSAMRIGIEHVDGWLFVTDGQVAGGVRPEPVHLFNALRVST